MKISGILYAYVPKTMKVASKINRRAGHVDSFVCTESCIYSLVWDEGPAALELAWVPALWKGLVGEQ